MTALTPEAWNELARLREVEGRYALSHDALYALACRAMARLADRDALARVMHDSHMADRWAELSRDGIERAAWLQTADAVVSYLTDTEGR